MSEAQIYLQAGPSVFERQQSLYIDKSISQISTKLSSSGSERKLQNKNIARRFFEKFARRSSSLQGKKSKHNSLIVEDKKSLSFFKNISFFKKSNSCIEKDESDREIEMSKIQPSHKQSGESILKQINQDKISGSQITHDTEKKQIQSPYQRQICHIKLQRDQLEIEKQYLKRELNSKQAEIDKLSEKVKDNEDELRKKKKDIEELIKNKKQKEAYKEIKEVPDDVHQRFISYIKDYLQQNQDLIEVNPIQFIEMFSDCQKQFISSIQYIKAAESVKSITGKQQQKQNPKEQKRLQKSQKGKQEQKYKSQQHVNTIQDSPSGKSQNDVIFCKIEDLEKKQVRNVEILEKKSSQSFNESEKKQTNSERVLKDSEQKPSQDQPLLKSGNGSFQDQPLIKSGNGSFQDQPLIKSGNGSFQDQPLKESFNNQSLKEKEQELPLDQFYLKSEKESSIFGRVINSVSEQISDHNYTQSKMSELDSNSLSNKQYTQVTQIQNILNDKLSDQGCLLDGNDKLQLSVLYNVMQKTQLSNVDVIPLYGINIIPDTDHLNRCLNSLFPKVSSRKIYKSSFCKIKQIHSSHAGMDSEKSKNFLSHLHLQNEITLHHLQENQISDKIDILITDRSKRDTHFDNLKFKITQSHSQRENRQQNSKKQYLRLNIEFESEDLKVNIDCTTIWTVLFNMENRKTSQIDLTDNDFLKQMPPESNFAFDHGSSLQLLAVQQPIQRALRKFFEVPVLVRSDLNMENRYLPNNIEPYSFHQQTVDNKQCQVTSKSMFVRNHHQRYSVDQTKNSEQNYKSFEIHREINKTLNFQEGDFTNSKFESHNMSLDIDPISQGSVFHEDKIDYEIIDSPEMSKFLCSYQLKKQSFLKYAQTSPMPLELKKGVLQIHERLILIQNAFDQLIQKNRQQNQKIGGHQKYDCKSYVCHKCSEKFAQTQKYINPEKHQKLIKRNNYFRASIYTKIMFCIFKAIPFKKISEESFAQQSITSLIEENAQSQQVMLQSLLLEESQFESSLSGLEEDEQEIFEASNIILNPNSSQIFNLLSFPTEEESNVKEQKKPFIYNQ